MARTHYLGSGAGIATIPNSVAIHHDMQSASEPFWMAFVSILLYHFCLIMVHQKKRNLALRKLIKT